MLDLGLVSEEKALLITRSLSQFAQNERLSLFYNSFQGMKGGKIYLNNESVQPDDVLVRRSSRVLRLANHLNECSCCLPSNVMMRSPAVVSIEHVPFIQSISSPNKQIRGHLLIASPVVVAARPVDDVDYLQFF